jgi:hypothetical protein
MLLFRLFFYDEANHITHAHEFEATSDGEAIRLSEAWREGHRMELWCRDRRVRCWGFEACARPGCAD